MSKKAFTLAELLVVVIVLGVLATVAVPKFSRVLETRKTTEAEELLASVRTEQERRCVSGKQYTPNAADIYTLASAPVSSNYRYALGSVGASAQSRSKDYSISMPSYKTGELCCSGSYCANLNKSYPACSAAAAVEDECAAEINNAQPEESPAADPCVSSPSSCACSTYASSHACECSGVCTECELDASKCCSSDEKFENGQCVPDTATEDTCASMFAETQPDQDHPCAANWTETQVCANGAGKQYRVCFSEDNSCTDWGECQMNCTPGQTKTESCGCNKAGTQKYTCNSSYTWEKTGSCSVADCPTVSCSWKVTEDVRDYDTGWLCDSGYQEGTCAGANAAGGSPTTSCTASNKGATFFTCIQYSTCPGGGWRKDWTRYTCQCS